MGGHHELVALAPAYALDALDPDERAAFAAHLAVCDRCAAQVRAYDRVVDVLAWGTAREQPRSDVRSRVLDAVAVRRLDRRARGLVPVWRWALQAAMIALAIGAAIYLASRTPDLEVSPAIANASALQVLAAGDLARIDLAAQPAAPAASARALWSRQRGMVFAVTGLPPLPPGYIYQVWVVTAGAPVSAGLLQPDATGQSFAVFTTPPDIGAPLAVAVTIEPAGGVPAPTGDKYLVGTPEV